MSYSRVHNSTRLGIAWVGLACSAIGFCAWFSGNAAEQICSVVVYTAVHIIPRVLLHVSYVQQGGGTTHLSIPTIQDIKNIALRKTPKLELLQSSSQKNQSSLNKSHRMSCADQVEQVEHEVTAPPGAKTETKKNAECCCKTTTAASPT